MACWTSGSDLHDLAIFHTLVAPRPAGDGEEDDLPRGQNLRQNPNLKARPDSSRIVRDEMDDSLFLSFFLGAWGLRPGHLCPPLFRGGVVGVRCPGVLCQLFNPPQCRPVAPM